MSSSDKTLNRLLQLQEKVELLISEHDSIKLKLREKEEENARLKKELRKKEEELFHFQNQDKISKIVNSVTVGEQGSTTELKLKINEYIKEIDKCIATLSE